MLHVLAATAFFSTFSRLTSGKNQSFSQSWRRIVGSGVGEARDDGCEPRRAGYSEEVNASGGTPDASWWRPATPWGGSSPPRSRQWPFPTHSQLAAHFGASWCVTSLSMNYKFEDRPDPPRHPLPLRRVDDVPGVSSKLGVKAMPTFFLIKA